MSAALSEPAAVPAGFGDVCTGRGGHLCPSLPTTSSWENVPIGNVSVGLTLRSVGVLMLRPEFPSFGTFPAQNVRIPEEYPEVLAGGPVEHVTLQNRSARTGGPPRTPGSGRN